MCCNHSCLVGEETPQHCLALECKTHEPTGAFRVTFRHKTAGGFLAWQPAWPQLPLCLCPITSSSSQVTLSIPRIIHLKAGCIHSGSQLGVLFTQLQKDKHHHYQMDFPANRKTPLLSLMICKMFLFCPGKRCLYSMCHRRTSGEAKINLYVSDGRFLAAGTNNFHLFRSSLP